MSEMSSKEFKVGDKVSTVYGEFEVLRIRVNEHSSKEIYVCYQKGFAGHSAIATLRGNDYRGTIYERQCWCFEEDDLELVKQPEAYKQPVVKNYREMKPNTLITISIDGNEFEVPLGDLVHAQALIGVGNGKFGYLIYTALKEVLDEEEVIYNNHDYDYVDTTTEQDLLMKAYFIDKEKEAKKQALKDVIEKQREEISKLEQQLIALDDYDGCSL